METYQQQEALPPVPPSSAALDEMIESHLREQNDLEYELGDKLDAKMNIALVFIAFLATQSGTFLSIASIPTHWYVVQVLSILSVAVAGIISIRGLIPTNYKVGLAPEEYLSWINGVRQFYGKEKAHDSDAKSIDFIRRRNVQLLVKRYAVNQPINAKKSWFVTAAYWLTAFTLGCNLLTLIALATGWRF